MANDVAVPLLLFVNEEVVTIMLLLALYISCANNTPYNIYPYGMIRACSVCILQK